MRWERDVPLARLARYRIGGPADRLARPASIEELRSALADLGGAPYAVLGTGANVLIAESGLRFALFILGGRFGELDLEDGAIRAGAATKLPALAGAARKSARVGFYFLEAVPGTVGGGLRMNAGAREDWLWHRVEWAEAVTPDGELVRVDASEANPSYRSVALPDEWIFVRARFTAEEGDPRAVREEHFGFRERKVRDQVYDLPSVGSTWKNPGAPHGSAWEVVDEVGMRGARIGGAQIAERHSNFIVNLGDARADDVLDLMVETRRRAHEQLGIWLEPEIRLWGFEPDRLAEVGAR
ncbi:MAG: UDP-N-acetylmuramate dehydrogenase [Gemmatimonadetes bacterium]|nr:UDP-N-acetylmuramate dehydrogenase [Gemmatimonadota bacterium]